MNPEQVKALQTQLKAQGLYDGAIDGIMGPKMQAAMSAAQAQNGQTEQAKAAAQAEAAKAQAEQAKAAAEAAKAQAVSSEAARLKAENDAKNDEARRIREGAASTSLKTYQDSTLGQGMGAARTLAPFLGVGAGYGDTLMARKFLGVNDGPLQAGPGKRFGILGAFGVPAGVAYGLGRFAEGQSQDPSNTHFQHDLDLAAANFGYGMMGGNATGGTMTAAKDMFSPGGLTSPEKKPITPPAPPPPPQLSEAAQRTVDVAKKMGAPEAVLNSHENATNWMRAQYTSKEGLNEIQRAALSEARKELGMGATASFGRVIGRLAPGLAVSAGLLAAFTPHDASAMQRLGDVADAASYAVPVVREARLMHDMMRNTPQIPEGETINGHSIIHPDDRAQYFSKLRLIANAFAQNRADYNAPRAMLNPQEVAEEPVFRPGSPYAPGSANVGRGAAYVGPERTSQYGGREALIRALLGQ